MTIKSKVSNGVLKQALKNLRKQEKQLLRNLQSLSWSRDYPSLTKAEAPLPRSQKCPNTPYPEPDTRSTFLTINQIPISSALKMITF